MIVTCDQVALPRPEGDTARESPESVEVMVSCGGKVYRDQIIFSIVCWGLLGYICSTKSLFTSWRLPSAEPLEVIWQFHLLGVPSLLHGLADWCSFLFRTGHTEFKFLVLPPTPKAARPRACPLRAKRSLDLRGLRVSTTILVVPNSFHLDMSLFLR